MKKGSASKRRKYFALNFILVREQSMVDSHGEKIKFMSFKLPHFMAD